jgi:heptosyltransferase-2
MAVNNKKTEILVVKLLGIGDVIMALPMLDAIKVQYPQSRVTWICCPSAKALLEDKHAIDELILIDDAILFGKTMVRVRHLLSLWIKLAGHRFDLIITGHRDWRYQMLTFPVLSGDRRSFSWPPVVRFRPVPGRWHGHEYVQLVSGHDDSSSLPASTPRLDFPLPKRFSDIFSNGRKVVALAPGGGRVAPGGKGFGLLRCWPVENYVALAERLLAKNRRVVLMGGQSDKNLAVFFSRLPVVNLLGETTLKETVGIYSECDVIVAHDSGPMHLAYASGAPLVALFGPTMPSERFPPEARGVFLWQGTRLACCPCHNGKTLANCSDNLCMQAITVEQVDDVVARIIERA